MLINVNKYVNKCNVFTQSAFSNPVSLTNDNEKIENAKRPSKISAEIKQTVKNKRKNIGLEVIQFLAML